MKRKSTSYHLEIQAHRRNPYGLHRNSYREDGRVLHETICRLTGFSIEQLRTIQASLLTVDQHFSLLDGVAFLVISFLRDSPINRVNKMQLKRIK